MGANLIEITVSLVGIGASGFFSWLFTHLYYKKSLTQQAGESSKQLAALVDLAGRANDTNRQLIMQKRIEEAIKEYRRAGTPVRVIDTYNDLTNEEKAQLFDTVFLRVKGRKAKTNKYRPGQ